MGLISPLVAFVSLKKTHTILKDTSKQRLVGSDTACAKGSIVWVVA